MTIGHLKPESVDVDKLVEVINNSIDTVNGIYCATSSCIHEFKNAQIHITITRDRDDFFDPDDIKSGIITE